MVRDVVETAIARETEAIIKEVRRVGFALRRSEATRVIFSSGALAEWSAFASSLPEQEAGAKTGDVCRKHGISSATFYKWKAKYGGLDVSDAKRLKVLEDENAKLKKLLAEAELDKAMLKEIAAKKW